MNDEQEALAYYESLKSQDALEDQDQEAQEQPVSKRLLTEEDILNHEMPPLLVDGLMFQGSLVEIASKPGVGKSFVAIDLALSIAAGKSTFLGKRLYQEGPVVYVIGEGLGRFKLRVMAWKQHHGVKSPLPFHGWSGPVNLLDQKEVDQFLDEAATVKPVLVVIDTLARCMVGGDENSVTDMGRAVAACDRIKTTLNSTVLVLHHMNRGGQTDRGSTAMPGALDSQFFLKTGKKTSGQNADATETPEPNPILPGRIRLCSEKQKELERGSYVELTKTVVTLNGIYEADQSPATSCVWMVTEEIDIPLREAEVIGLVREHLGKSKSFIANRMKGIRTKNRFALINKLVDDGHLVDSCGLWLPEDFDSSKPLSPASVGYLKIPPRRKQSDRKEREAQN